MTKSNKVEAWLPLYVADYLADTSRFTTEQHGAYLLIIFDYWRNGPPPDDDTMLAQVTKLTPEKWRAMRSTIAAKFRITGGVWRHKRIDEELEKARNLQAGLSKRGKAGAEARWKDDATANATANGSGNATASAKPMPKECQTDAPSPTPTPLTLTSLPSPAPTPRASRKRDALKTRLPDGFAISDRVRNWAAEKGFARLPEHLESFVSKCRAKGYTYVDWDEALMGAIRDDWAGTRKVNGHGSHDSAIAEAERRIFGDTTEKDITGESVRI